MEKQVINSYRIAYENWYDTKRFHDLLELFDRYRDAVDQIAFFTSATHPPLTLKEAEHRIKIIAERILETKARGYSSCGINNLGTLGHHCEDLENHLNEPYTRMTNIDGGTTAGTYCMNDPSFLEGYIKPLYTLLAKAKPDFIWIDDDIRYSHIGLGNGCFCDRCIDIFNSKNGTCFTRDALKEVLRFYEIPLRKKWLRHQSASISRLLKFIRGTVESVSKNIKLGFMTGERYFEGYDFAGFADELSGSGAKKIMWRPGGGAYTDTVLDAFVEKSSQIGRQTAYLPPYVDSIQSEIENFPYQLLKKSPRATAMEAAIYLSSGCTGTAFNIFPSENNEPILGIEPHIREIAKNTGFYRLLSETLGRSPIVGIHTGWCTDSQTAVPDDFVNGWGGNFASYARELFTFGLPEAYNFDAACAYMLTGNGVRALTESQILKVLSTGIYLDAGAINALNDMGYGEYVGFRVGDIFPVDAREQFLEHPLNTGITDGLRNCRQAFNGGDSFALIPQKGAEILCNLTDYHGNVIADCSMGIFKNSLGGIVCGAGYYPFSWISDTYKTIQLGRLFCLLSGDTLPCYLESYSRIRSMAHKLPDGSLAAILLNMDIARTENVYIYIKIDCDRISVTDMECNTVTLNSIGESDGYRKFNIPVIEPWGLCLITEVK